MTHRLLVQYGTPTDPAAFDRYYREVHIPLGQQIPGVVRFDVGRPSPLDDSAAPYLVAALDFESEQAMGEALRSPEGRATGKDLANFATGGVTLAHFAVQTVR